MSSLQSVLVTIHDNVDAAQALQALQDAGLQLDCEAQAATDTLRTSGFVAGRIDPNAVSRLNGLLVVDFVEPQRTAGISHDAS